MANLKKLLGARIKEIRTARNMTQEKFAELININPSNISKIETGRYRPSEENLAKIADALNVPPYKLYMNEHNKPIDELKQDINNLLETAADNDIRLAYKILNGIII